MEFLAFQEKNCYILDVIILEIISLYTSVKTRFTSMLNTFQHVFSYNSKVTILKYFSFDTIECLDYYDIYYIFS